jgi:hypothetical protein
MVAPSPLLGVVAIKSDGESTPWGIDALRSQTAQFGAVVCANCLDHMLTLGGREAVQQDLFKLVSVFHRGAPCRSVDRNFRS